MTSLHFHQIAALYFCYTEYRFIKYGSWHAEKVVVLCWTVSQLKSLYTTPVSQPISSFVCLKERKKKKRRECVGDGWKIGHFPTCSPPLEHHHASNSPCNIDSQWWQARQVVMKMRWEEVHDVLLLSNMEGDHRSTFEKNWQKWQTSPSCGTGGPKNMAPGYYRCIPHAPIFFFFFMSVPVRVLEDASFLLDHASSVMIICRWKGWPPTISFEFKLGTFHPWHDKIKRLGNKAVALSG
jgi:hypothetical protein